MGAKCGKANSKGEVWKPRAVKASKAFIGLCLALALGALSLAQVKEFGPQVRKTEDGVSYVSTGVGKDSRENLPKFSLKLVFSTKTARYLANIETEILPASSGKPIRIRSVGPWLLVDLAPGKYTVKARTAKGQEVTKTIEIAKGRVTHANLVWNISDEDI
jgi:hypothetical protein